MGQRRRRRRWRVRNWWSRSHSGSYARPVQATTQELATCLAPTPVHASASALAPAPASAFAPGCPCSIASRRRRRRRRRTRNLCWGLLAVHLQLKVARTSRLHSGSYARPVEATTQELTTRLAPTPVYASASAPAPAPASAFAPGCPCSIASRRRRRRRRRTRNLCWGLLAVHLQLKVARTSRLHSGSYARPVEATTQELTTRLAPTPVYASASAPAPAPASAFAPGHRRSIASTRRVHAQWPSASREASRSSGCGRRLSWAVEHRRRQ